ncbi:MAG TPA: FkbM family methyltransferase [Pseudolabrys sp.]|nr:FkbM family methyltransferase [Pseudolabrys sp.]
MRSPYLLENRHVAVKRCRHGLMMFSRNDLFVGRSLDAYGEWCDFEIQLMRVFLKAGDVAIDAGANIGTHTIAFANSVGPQGRVHAFEPMRRNFCMLAGNVALNALENVVCHQKAVGAVNGEISVPVLPDPEISYNYSAIHLSEESKQGERVPIVTLDSLDLQACRVIKIDTEGMEDKVLDGAQALIKRCRPLIYLENNEAGASERLAKALDKINYQAWWSISPHYEQNNFYSNFENFWPNVVPATNLICAPKEANLQIGLDPFTGPKDDWKASLQRVGYMRPFQPKYGPQA